jgi:hypothetical protein
MQHPYLRPSKVIVNRKITTTTNGTATWAYDGHSGKALKVETATARKMNKKNIG